MLGYVHAGIGDANNIFHGKPVYGKASHAKAAGNVLFLKHGISRYPQAQALGQYLRLFDSGFRHQDNEFVPAVASHYIRLPALLLKESANASRSEEHTSELQSRFDLVCRLLLEKKKNKDIIIMIA